MIRKGSSLQTATDIQAGVAPVQPQEQAQRWPITQQQAKIQQQQQQLNAEQQQEMEAAKIAADKAAIAAGNRRFGELGDYNIWGETTVYFANGKANVDPQYFPQLQAPAKKHVTVTANMIQVQGYGSKVGSAYSHCGL